MILLGLTDAKKQDRVRDYCKGHAIRKVFVFSPKKFRRDLDVGAEIEHIEWAEIILYKFYYRLLQEIGPDCLIVINECLRTQNRYELTYNCLRLFLQQAGHQLVFQFLPLIDTVEDFQVLFDFDTRSRWKRESFKRELLKECQIEIHQPDLSLVAIGVPVDEGTKAAYAKEKRKLIDGIGLKDPNTIPRNLYLMGGKAKLERVDPSSRYIGRNNRFGINNFQTYREDSYAPPYTVFEFCHNFIDFADFLSLSRQEEIPVMVADLKVDHWYLQRYQEWIGRIRNAYSILRG